MWEISALSHGQCAKIGIIWMDGSQVMSEGQVYMMVSQTDFPLGNQSKQIQIKA